MAKTFLVILFLWITAIAPIEEPKQNKDATNAQMGFAKTVNTTVKPIRILTPNLNLFALAFCLSHPSLASIKTALHDPHTWASSGFSDPQFGQCILILP
jgi:hypothetical protein